MSGKAEFQIVDTTLRDGEQSAGIVFSEEEKINMATNLDRAGVRWIEAGTPAMGKKEQKTMKLLLKLPLQATLIAWNRAQLEDIQKSIACGFSCIHVSLPISDLNISYKFKKDREWVIQKLKTALQLIKSYGCSIIVGAEDASRADPEFFLRFADTAAEFGAMRIRFSDTVGCLDPFVTFDSLKDLVNRCSIPIEFHGHNDFGMATANTLSAFQAGAKFASTTLSGIGERAGNASLEEVAAALENLYNHSSEINLKDLPLLNNLVMQASNRKPFPYKPIVGGINKEIYYKNDLNRNNLQNVIKLDRDMLCCS
ncbi:homocitrate synthase [Clostridiaceae bacterium UIB06]|uniref:Homocitrate synthase n=1 Tax=Clostridium thailandense TaxID=2794346 RepID=A0A949TK09_9CLOT|nr:homocitrate synthase [Clostridium thailandense]MBV7273720.1 homocitrate synthase [Clostridium thailandense]MCH5137500.1 homocitrate synthase [Clostridiaceae bacterium UIB06]